MSRSKRVDNRIVSAILNDELLGKLDWKVLLFSFFINLFFQLKDYSSSVFGYIGLAVMIAALFVVDNDNHMYLFIAVVGGNRLFSFMGVPLLNVVTAVYFLEKYLFAGAYKKKKIDAGIIAPFIVMVIFCLRFFIEDGSLRMEMIFAKIFLTFVILLDAIQECKTTGELKDKVFLIGIYFSIGMFIACIIPLAIFMAQGNTSRFSMSEKSGENPLAVLLGVGIAFDMVLVMENRSRIVNILMLLMVLPMIYVGVLTQSRSFIFIFLMILAWVAVFGLLNKKTRKTVLIVGIILAVVSVLFWKFGGNIGFHKTIESCVDRIVNPKNDDISNGRTAIWGVYMDSFLTDKKIMFFGSSSSAFGGERKTMAHNMFIEVIYSYGIIGTAIIIWIYGAFIRKLYVNFKRLGCGRINLFGMLPLLMMIAGGMGSHSFMGTQPIVEMFFGLCTMFCSDFKIIQKEKKNKRRYGYYYESRVLR